MLPHDVDVVQVHRGEVAPDGVAQVLPAEQVPAVVQLWQVPSVPQRYAPQTSAGLVVQLGWQIPTESSVVTLSQT